MYKFSNNWITASRNRKASPRKNGEQGAVRIHQVRENTRAMRSMVSMSCVTSESVEAVFREEVALVSGFKSFSCS